MNNIKSQFPIFDRWIESKPLIYLDSAASAQKPKMVIEGMNQFMTQHYANVHRGLYKLSQESTMMYEEARKKTAQYIHANHFKEIIFTGGTTESINLIASSYAKPILKSGDTILLSQMEHHSNLLPWQQLAKEKNINLEFILVSKNGELDLNDFECKIKKKPKLLSVTHISNVLGTINPIKQIIQLAHQYDVKVLIDGAQGIVHESIDVDQMDCDFYVFSSHKLYGPTGVGVLYAKSQLLDQMEPYQFGGEMVESVDFLDARFADFPAKFEAGTPNLVGVIGLGYALDFMLSLDPKLKKQQETQFVQHGLKQLSLIKGLKFLGESLNKAAIFSFYFDDVHTQDIAMVLDQENICVRSGHHCAQPLHRIFNVSTSLRASMAVYNSIEDIDRLCEGLNKAKRMLKP